MTVSKTTIYSCPNCGSRNVQHAMWVSMNVGIADNCSQADDDYWCPDCDTKHGKLNTHVETTEDGINF